MNSSAPEIGGNVSSLRLGAPVDYDSWNTAYDELAHDVVRNRPDIAATVIELAIPTQRVWAGKLILAEIDKELEELGVPGSSTEVAIHDIPMPDVSASAAPSTDANVIPIDQANRKRCNRSSIKIGGKTLAAMPSNDSATTPAPIRAPRTPRSRSQKA